MSMSELHSWVEYLSKEPTNSIEIQLALLTTVVANMMGGKKKLDDFLITAYKPEKDSVFVPEEQVVSIFAALAS